MALIVTSINKLMQHYYKNIGEDWFTYPNLYRSAVAQYDNARFLEVGSWKGRSVSFLGVEVKNQEKNIHITCVDTWCGSVDHPDFAKIDGNVIYNTFIENIEPIKDIITPVKMTSLEASETFEDETFDFIFIDAAHDYENVLKDMTAWYPKLKNGGLFSGHDYGTWAGVTKAVDEWVAANNIQDFIANYEEHTWSFYKSSCIDTSESINMVI